MKEIKQLGIAFILSLFILVACKKTDDTSVNSIVGTYVGTYSAESGTKSISVVQASNEAIAEITNIGNGQI
jgi:major membrane immunogen (membrane-anchored lipoprotein)